MDMAADCESSNSIQEKPKICGLKQNLFVSFRRNIYSGMEYNFDRYDTTMVNDYSIPYDYLSIMHYGQYVRD